MSVRSAVKLLKLPLTRVAGFTVCPHLTILGTVVSDGTADKLLKCILTSLKSGSVFKLFLSVSIAYKKETRHVFQTKCTRWDLMTNFIYRRPIESLRLHLTQMIPIH